MDITAQKELSFITITVRVTRLGEDFAVIVSGGKCHVGGCVLALPRPSLTGDGTVSSTASVLNVTGHKDEEILRYIAQEISAKKNTVVVCSGGVHTDNITKEQIAEIKTAIKEITQELLLSL